MAKQALNSEFELMRERLTSQYHSDIITHSGYIIALVIGIFSIIANYKDFFEGGAIATSIFYLCISVVFGIGCYFTGRVYYWTSLSNAVLSLTERQFNEYKDRVQPIPKDGKIAIDRERSDISHMQKCGCELIHNYPVITPQVILAKLSFKQLIGISTIVTLIVLNTLFLVSMWYGIL